MERLYTVTLKFSQAIPHPVFETKFEDYINSSGLFVPEKTHMIGVAGTSLAAEDKDGNYIRFDWNSAHIQPNTYLEELEAVKRALTTAKKLESVAPPFDPRLAFNPNFISIFVGEGSEGNYMLVKDFIPHANGLQEILYYGGNIAYSESSGHFVIFLGTEKEIDTHKILSGKEIVESEGTAQPASSLDELLQRLEQKPQ